MPTENVVQDRQKSEANTTPSRPARWRPLASSGGTVVAVAFAAAFTSYTAEQAVGITAWVAVAVIGTSAMISTAKNVR